MRTIADDVRSVRSSEPRTGFARRGTEAKLRCLTPVECMAELVRWFVAVGGGTAVVMVIRKVIGDDTKLLAVQCTVLCTR